MSMFARLFCETLLYRIQTEVHHFWHVSLVARKVTETVPRDVESRVDA